MKPRFALDLSHEAVSLLERAAGGWVRIGRALLDDPSLGDQLAGMRALAQVRAPEGFISKLILPNSQILYFELDAPGADQAARRARIQEALVGRTPYAVEDLVFDFSRQGDHLKVAVVARETLEEAEGFAEAYGFRPAGFVAIPEASHFAGEPFFGLTSVASLYLPADTRFDRDQDPARVIAQADAPLAALFRALPGLASASATSAGETSADPAEPEIPAPDEAELTPEGNGPDITEPDPASPTSLSPSAAEANEATLVGAETFAEPGSTSDGQPLPDDDAQFQDLALADATPSAESAPTKEKPSADTPMPSDSGFEPDADAEREPATLPVPAQDIAAAPPATPSGDEEAPFAEVSDTDEAAQGAPPTDLQPKDAEPAAFHSRRAPRLDEETRDEPGARLAAILPRLGGIRARNPGTPDVSAAPALGAPERDDAASPRPRLPAAQSTSFDANAKHLPEAEGSPGLFAKRHATDRGATSAVFGGIKLPQARRLASPRVQLGVAGLLAIAAIGLWAIFLGPATVPQVSAPAPVSTAPAALPAPETNTAQVDLPQPTATAQQPAKIAEPTPDADIGTVVAAEGATPETTDVNSLPQSTALITDPPLAAQPQPQPFGTLLRFDELGLIAATPEGVVTPDGFTLVAGQPPRLPPARATRAQPAAEPNPLAGKRPRPRPANLVPVSAPANAETTLAPSTTAAATLAPLAPPVDPRHAARQPKARPSDFLAKAAARRQADEAVADAAASAARAEAEAAAKALAATSPLAVATSRQPAPRSPVARAAAKKAELAAAETASQVDNSAVEAALAEAQTATEPSPEPEPEPEPANVEVDEPEPQEGIATLPTTRTVAKKSTLANAIDLGDINLIGVYGSSANRRALVRMPSGRFVKVQVGDRIDGGKVAAISDNELRYVKGGKTYSLKMVNDG